MSIKLLFNVLAYVLLTLVILTGGVYVYSKFFEEPWLSYKVMPFEVKAPNFAGNPIVYTIIRCNDSGRTKTYTTTRSIQKMGGNQPPFILPSTDLSVEPGCEPASPIINVIPDNATPGFYRFMGVAKVQGIFDTHEVIWSTKVFEVLPKVTKDAELVLHADDKNIKVEVLP